MPQSDRGGKSTPHTQSAVGAAAYDSAARPDLLGGPRIVGIPILSVGSPPLRKTSGTHFVGKLTEGAGSGALESFESSDEAPSSMAPSEAAPTLQFADGQASLEDEWEVAFEAMSHADGESVEVDHLGQASLDLRESADRAKPDSSDADYIEVDELDLEPEATRRVAEVSYVAELSRDSETANAAARARPPEVSYIAELSFSQEIGHVAHAAHPPDATLGQEDILSSEGATPVPVAALARAATLPDLDTAAISDETALPELRIVGLEDNEDSADDETSFDQETRRQADPGEFAAFEVAPGPEAFLDVPAPHPSVDSPSAAWKLPPPPTAEQAPPRPSAAPSATARVVMVVEDDPTIREMVTRSLGAEYCVYEAADGVAALDMLTRMSTPDLLLLDVKMPRMDGLALAGIVRADARMRSVPIIFLSGLDAPRDVVNGINAGARHYLTKPFKMKDLMRRVDRALRHRAV